MFISKLVKKKIKQYFIELVVLGCKNLQVMDALGPSPDSRQLNCIFIRALKNYPQAQIQSARFDQSADYCKILPSLSTRYSFLI